MKVFPTVPLSGSFCFMYMWPPCIPITSQASPTWDLGTGCSVAWSILLPGGQMAKFISLLTLCSNVASTRTTLAIIIKIATVPNKLTSHPFHYFRNRYHMTESILTESSSENANFRRLQKHHTIHSGQWVKPSYHSIRVYIYDYMYKLHS